MIYCFFDLTTPQAPYQAPYHGIYIIGGKKVVKQKKINGEAL